MSINRLSWPKLVTQVTAQLRMEVMTDHDQVTIVDYPYGTKAIWGQQTAVTAKMSQSYRQAMIMANVTTPSNIPIKVTQKGIFFRPKS